MGKIIKICIFGLQELLTKLHFKKNTSTEFSFGQNNHDSRKDVQRHNGKLGQPRNSHR